jgi:4-amino-4-deoxy-L-arabinose transferase-like glycosyltransferase
VRSATLEATYYSQATDRDDRIEHSARVFTWATAVRDGEHEHLDSNQFVGHVNAQQGDPTDTAPAEVRPTRLPDRFRLTPARALLLLIAGLAGLSYAWGISQDPLEPFYAAAVRSMAINWHNFFFGSFDPAGTITLDKLPGAFWIQALSVRIFGYHTWAIVLPQVIEGVLSVLVLYRAVNRLRGTTAALIAALILAASPATVALNRGNIADTAMTLFLVLAADAVSAAIVSGRQRHLVFAGLWIGIAFQAKMLEAWVVLPAFGLAYLFGRTDGLAHKLRQVVVAGLVAGVVSLSWMTIVTLTPAADRPYVDGSQHNSVYEQVFVYDGFGRTSQQTAFQQFLGGVHLPQEVLNGPSPAWNRLVQGDLGRDTGWLLPVALAIGVGGLFTRRRSYFILWTGWLIPMVLVFSDVFIFHSYYTAALSPPMAAILGAGIAGLWASRTEVRAVAARRGAAAGLLVAGTVGYGIWLIQSSVATAPGWLWPLAASMGAVAVVLLLASAAASSHRRLLVVALVAGTAAILVIPAAASGFLVAEQRGISDTPFESTQTAALYDALLGTSSRGFGSFFPQLEKLQMGSPYVMAVYTSAVASEFISATGKEVLPIGGFTGTIPEPTISQLEGMIRTGKFHLALLIGGHDPRLTWIATHCRHLGPGAGAFGLLFCTPNDAPAARG